MRGERRGDGWQGPLRNSELAECGEQEVWK